MDSGRTSISTGPHPVSLRHAALIGILLSIALCLAFWATAAAQGLPASTPAWVRNFQPATGIEHLVQGLFWTGVAGGVVFVLLALSYNFVRRASHGRPAR